MLDAKKNKKQSRLWGLKWAEWREKQVSDYASAQRGRQSRNGRFLFLSSQYFHLCRYSALLAVDEPRVPAWAKHPLHWAFTGVTDSFGFVFVLESRPDSGRAAPSTAPLCQQQHETRDPKTFSWVHEADTRFPLALFTLSITVISERNVKTRQNCF